jgi:hypothetical protein
MKLRRYFFVSFWLLACVPFIFMTDIFPFFRFGMFAEPVKYNSNTEKFELLEQNEKNKKWQMVESMKHTGVAETQLAYLLRNYYYKKELPILIGNFERYSGKKNRMILRLNAATYPPDTLEKIYFNQNE